MKTKNLVVCFGVLMLSVCLFFETGHAATYYVKTSGNDNASGLDDQNAWRTIKKVNNFVFSEGDVVLFKRGDTFSDKGLRISNLDNFSIADYGEGEKPLFDGNKEQPIYIWDSKNITIKNIDISGQEWHINKSSNISVNNVEGISIDGIYGNGHTIKGEGATEGKNAVGIVNCSGIIEVKNCELFNWGPYDMLASDSEQDFMGIALMEVETGEYKIHDNKIHNIYADAIHVYLTKATGKIYDNIIYNSGENGIDVKGSENVEIYDNKFYRTAEFSGEGGSGSGGIPTHVVVHDGGDKYSKNNSIRSNSFTDGDIAAVRLGKAENTNIYENSISKVKTALYIQNYVKNTKFHHNIIENPQSRPHDSKNMDLGCIYENNSHTGTEIYNNTIYNGKGSSKHLITLGCSYGTAVYNNIVFQGNASEDAFGLYYNSCGTDPVIRDNYWYNPNKINRTNYSNRIYTANMQEEWNEKHPGDKFDDPLMNDPEAGDYSLYEKDLKIGAVYGGEDPSLTAEMSVEVLVIFIQNPDADLEQLVDLVFQKTGTKVSTEQIQTLFDDHGLNI